jgi:hypothetical protein
VSELANRKSPPQLEHASGYFDRHPRHGHGRPSSHPVAWMHGMRISSNLALNILLFTITEISETYSAAEN